MKNIKFVGTYFNKTVKKYFGSLFEKWGEIVLENCGKYPVLVLEKCNGHVRKKSFNLYRKLLQGK